MAVRPRLSLRTFSVQCEQILRDNDYKRGWALMSVELLFRRLREECDELLLAISRGNRKAISKEVCDVGNFAMMIHDLQERVSR